MYCRSEAGGEAGVRGRREGEVWREGRRKEKGEGRKKAEARRGIPTLQKGTHPDAPPRGGGHSHLTDAKPKA